MTVELKPDTERLVQEEMRSGHFQSLDELIVQGVRAWREKFSEGAMTGNTGKPVRTRAEAAAHMRAARVGNRLPEGVTLHDMIDKGRA
jgi:Arc/MetJ-type ribon-helix-helix transcriptional regulator